MYTVFKGIELKYNYRHLAKRVKQDVLRGRGHSRREYSAVKITRLNTPQANPFKNSIHVSWAQTKSIEIQVIVSF